MPDLDVAVVGQDPWFGGGFRSLVTAFWTASHELGRDPHLFYLARGRRTSLLRPGIAWKESPVVDGELRGTAFPSQLPELDSVNQVVGGLRMAGSLRAARTLWVVAASAPYGYAAARSGKPYACWIATSMRGEWAVRQPLLPASRRAALRINTPTLLRLERTVLREARAIYAISPSSRDDLAAAASVPAERVRALPIPIDFAQYQPQDDATWLRGLEHPTITFVGRARDVRKNVALLLDAFTALRTRLPAARLRLVGEPPAPGTWLPPGVEVAGVVPDVAKELAASSLFVLPSWQEGFGIVVAEALACGAPAVVTPSGGPETLVRDSGGGRVLSGFDAEELAATLHELLSDPDALLAARHRGRDYVVAEHSPERLRELLAVAYTELDGER